MSMATDYSSNHRSPKGTGFTGDNLNSPEFRRRNLRSPWAQVVRGEPESISPVDQSPLSSSSSLSSLAASATETPAATASPPADNFTSSENHDANDGGNATAPTRKPAWNKPSNGVVEVGPVMGADSWPALSDSAWASPKLAVDSSVKPTIEVSVPPSQGPINVPPQRQATNNAKSNPSPKHPAAARQRSSKRGGGGGGSSVEGPARRDFSRAPPPPPPPFPVFHIPASSYCNLLPAIPDPSSGEPLFGGNNWDPRAVAGFVPQTNFTTDYRNFFPRGNFTLHPRGDGHYHNNRGGKRDQDRRRIYSNAQDVNFQQHRSPPIRGFMRSSPPYTAQFPQPVRPHGNPMPPPEFVYVPTLPLEPYRGIPFMPRPVMYHPAVDPSLCSSVVQQIEYYFSDDNLIRDNFLRSWMDDQGWVPISLIAAFPRVKKLTNNIQTVVESLRTSTFLEMQDNRIRRRNGWKRFAANPNWLRANLSSSSPSGSSHDDLATSFQRIKVDEGMNQSMTSDSDPHNTECATQIRSFESAGSSQLINGEVDQDVQTDI